MSKKIESFFFLLSVAGEAFSIGNSIFLAHNSFRQDAAVGYPVLQHLLPQVLLIAQLWPNHVLYSSIRNT
jgi:hypothetical protein